MDLNMTTGEIANLQKNNIKLKIPRVEGYLVKKSSFSSNLKWFYSRRIKTLYQCKKSGLNYQYFNLKSNNACYVFTECRFDFNDSEQEMELKEGSIIVTIYESPEDFMASSLAAYYRRYYTDNALCSWDEFGYFRTDSKSYNSKGIVKAISKLRPNIKNKRASPKAPIGLPNDLFR